MTDDAVRKHDAAEAARKAERAEKQAENKNSGGGQVLQKRDSKTGEIIKVAKREKVVEPEKDKKPIVKKKTVKTDDGFSIEVTELSDPNTGKLVKKISKAIDAKTGGLINTVTTYEADGTETTVVEKQKPTKGVTVMKAKYVSFLLVSQICSQVLDICLGTACACLFAYLCLGLEMSKYHRPCWLLILSLLLSKLILLKLSPSFWSNLKKQKLKLSLLTKKQNKRNEVRSSSKDFLFVSYFFLAKQEQQNQPKPKAQPKAPVETAKQKQAREEEERRAQKDKADQLRQEQQAKKGLFVFFYCCKAEKT